MSRSRFYVSEKDFYPPALVAMAAVLLATLFLTPASLDAEATLSVSARAEASAAGGGLEGAGK